MGQLLDLTISAPCGWLNANGREHWRIEALKISLWRNAGRVAARQAKAPKLQRAHILATFHFRTNARRDIHNWMPTVKALIDGLVDYRLLPDDSTEYLIGPDLRVGEKLPHRTGPAPVGEVNLAIREVTT